MVEIEKPRITCLDQPQDASYPGSQKVNQHEYGKSITDPCLGWDETEKLLDKIAESL